MIIVSSCNIAQLTRGVPSSNCSKSTAMDASWALLALELQLLVSLPLLSGRREGRPRAAGQAAMQPSAAPVTHCRGGERERGARE